MLYVVVSIVSKRNGRRNGRPGEWRTLLVWQGGTDQELNMFMGLNGAKLLVCLPGSIASSHSGKEC